ncbi:RNA polymerase sigma factor [Streptomyces physcomitrii]|uniref:RNA polymerase sigma factor n=1 Tax=Streptomyces physcomitrii TaxID=2724184 RepID=UPI0033C4B435
MTQPDSPATPGPDPLNPLDPLKRLDTLDPLDGLYAAARADGGEALDRLLAEIRPLMLRRCARLLPCLDDAEEACQDALLSVARNLDSFTGAGSFRGWVTVIASNAARATYRRLKRRAETAALIAPPEPVDPRTTSVIAGSRLDLLDALEELEARHPELVESVVLRDLASLSYAEVARRTGVPLGTAQARIHRARRFLRPRLSVVEG